MGFARWGWTACALAAAAWLLLAGEGRPGAEGVGGAETGLQRVGAGHREALRHTSAQPERRLHAEAEAPAASEEGEEVGTSEEGEELGICKSSPHEHEGGEAEGEGRKEEHKVSITTRVIASLLLGFLVVDIMLLHLVNYQDPDVRSYMYTMICATMSIFCAVLLNQAWCSFITDQLLMGQDHRGFGLKKVGTLGHVLVGGFTFVSAFTLLNVLCYKYRMNPKRITAVEDIGGHITAFAGVRFFGWEQYREMKACWSPVWCVGLAMLVLWLFCYASWRVRKTYFLEAASGPQEAEREEGEELEEQDAAAGPGSSREDDQGEEDLQARVKGEHRWRHAITKAENEAVGIITSFLTFQAVTFEMTGHLERPEEGHEHEGGHAHSYRDIWRLFYASVVVLVLIVLTTYVVNIRERRSMGGKTPTAKLMTSKELFQDQNERLTNLWETYLAMTLSWITMRVVYWIMRLYFEEDRHISQVATAGVVTVIAVCTIIALDFIADWINERKHQRREAAKVLSFDDSLLHSPPSQQQGQPQQPSNGRPRPRQLDDSSSSATSEEETSGDSGHNIVQVARRGMPEVKRISSALFREDNLLNAVIMDESSLERALRTIIVGFSLLVGLCWEKAFDAADESLVEGFPLCHRHPVIAKIIMAVGNAVLVIPAWLKFMVPMAKMRWTEHQAMMDLEKLQAATLTQDSRTNMAMFIAAANNLSPEDLKVATKSSLRRLSPQFAAELCAELQADLDKPT